LPYLPDIAGVMESRQWPRDGNQQRERGQQPDRAREVVVNNQDKCNCVQGMTRGETGLIQCRPLLLYV
jgi:hypothetical protein